MAPSKRGKFPETNFSMSEPNGRITIDEVQILRFRWLLGWGIFPSEEPTRDRQLPVAGSNVVVGSDEAGGTPSIVDPPSSMVADGSMGESEDSDDIVAAGGSIMCSWPIFRTSTCTRRFILRQVSLVSMHSTPSSPKLTVWILCSAIPAWISSALTVSARFNPNCLL